MKSKKLVLVIFIQICFLIPSSIKSQQPDQQERKEKSNCPCLNSKIRFDDSSLEMLVLHPEEVLTNPDAFWANDSAYKMVKQWHKNISFPVPVDQWNKWMQDLKNVPVNERTKNTQLVAAQTTMKKEKEFNEKAIPYICSFLPMDCPELDITIYFTTAIMASGFQMGNSIVIYCANADKDNMFIHEMFHQGYDKCKQKNVSGNHQDSVNFDIYGSLQNEGMATYAGYKALSEFPHIRIDMLKDDYKMFENIEDVKSLLHSLNNLLKKAFTLTEKELRDSLWQLGSMDRAYYVVGCYMAKTIDEKLGRDVLIGTIPNGPESFLSAYNSLIDEKFRVYDLYKLMKN
jgi:hypothetical protein